VIGMATRPTVDCPRCGSEKVTNRRGRFWLIVAIMVLGCGPVIVNGVVDGWDWMTVAGLVGLGLVALLNALAAIAAPWKCEKCGSVWH
jgi:hypothetical protein